MKVSRVLLVWSCCWLNACVMPRVQTSPGHAQEPALEEARVTLPDGAHLPLRRWLPPSGEPRAFVVAVHGLNDYSDGFASAAEYLAAGGFGVYAFDQRGFGDTEQRGIWAGGDVMADDVRRVAELVRLKHPGVPLYALGESMGGAVLLRALQQQPHGWVDAVVLLAPAVWNRRELPLYGRIPLSVLAHTWRGLELSGRSLHRSPSDDPEALRRLHEDPLVIKKTRVDVLWGIADLMDAATDGAIRFEVPLLILSGAHDEIVPPQATCAWIRSLDQGAGWQFAVYANGWHMLTRDLDAQTVLVDLAAWLAQPGIALPSGTDAGGRAFCSNLS